MRNFTFHVIARNRNRFLVRKAADVCRRFLNAYENVDGNFRSNGELRLAGLVVPPNGTVLDVGANVGEYATALLRTLPDVCIHCFEVCPDLVSALQQRFEFVPHVVVNGFGLLDEAKPVEVFYRPEASSVTSLIPSPEPAQVRQGRVITGDEYVEGAGIDRIDLLKIDAEGTDLAVLRGFRHSMESGIVRVVQFEHGPWSRLARVFLRDFFEQLDPLDYRIGRVFPTHVDFHREPPGRDDFRLSNYVAVSALETQTIERLSRR